MKLALRKGFGAYSSGTRVESVMGKLPKQGDTEVQVLADKKVISVPVDYLVKLRDKS